MKKPQCGDITAKDSIGINKVEKIFESERIDFVKLSQDLVDDYLKMVNDPAVATKIRREPIYFSHDDEAKWIEEKLAKRANIYSMMEKESGDFIGNIEFVKIDGEEAEIGIVITPEKQNLHFGTEALKALIEFGENNLNLKSFNLNVFDENARAIHCYEKVGFVKSGTGEHEHDIHMIYKK